MNKAAKNPFKHHLNIDGAANAGVLATGMVIVLIAAAAAFIDPEPKAAQFVYQDPSGRIVVTAIRSKTGKTSPAELPHRHGNPVQLAASSPTEIFQPNQHPDGDNHAR
jgi:hypothetical protein